MAHFDQRKQHVETQINAETVKIFTGNDDSNISANVQSLLDNEILKYLDMGFEIRAHSNEKVILVRSRRTSIGDWFILFKFLWGLIFFTIRNFYKIFTQDVLHERVDKDLQVLLKNMSGAEHDWVQIKIDKSGNIQTIFEPPLPDEIKLLQNISKESATKTAHRLTAVSRDEPKSE